MKEINKKLILEGHATKEIYPVQDLQVDFQKTQNGKLLKNYNEDYNNAKNELFESGKVRMNNPFNMEEAKDFIRGINF